MGYLRAVGLGEIKSEIGKQLCERWDIGKQNGRNSREIEGICGRTYLAGEWGDRAKKSGVSDQP